MKLTLREDKMKCPVSRHINDTQLQSSSLIYIILSIRPVSEQKGAPGDDCGVSPNIRIVTRWLWTIQTWSCPSVWTNFHCWSMQPMIVSVVTNVVSTPCYMLHRQSWKSLVFFIIYSVHRHEVYFNYLVNLSSISKNNATFDQSFYGLRLTCAPTID
jgi:hypothetical protein